MTHPSDAPHAPETSDPREEGREDLAEEPGGAADAALRARVEQALDLTRALLTPEEVEEQRRMLFSLARSHPRFSTWLEDQRPRAVPDESGVVQKKGEAALRTALVRRASGGGRTG